MQEAAAHILNDIHPFTITVRHAVVTGQQTHRVEQDEEQQRTEQAAAHGDPGAQRRKDRPHGTPEDRVAHACQRPHQTNFDTVDGTIVDLSPVRTLLFHCQRHAQNRRRNIRMGVEEFQVTLNCLTACFVVFRIQAFDGRHHGEAEAERLHTFEVP
ncbi:Uncharacterised protein [Enterobacter cloacae]|nr:Uncharacterised protein [Enterobacter cloacae]